MTKEWAPDDIFDVLGCRIARRVLAAASVGPRTVAELADACDVSAPTVYRRVAALEEHGLMTHEIEPAPDGHHTKRFNTVLDEATLRVEPTGITLDLVVDREYPDRFAQFWRDLGTGTEGLRSHVDGRADHATTVWGTEVRPHDQ